MREPLFLHTALKFCVLFVELLVRFLRNALAWVWTFFISLVLLLGGIFLKPSNNWSFWVKKWATVTLWLLGVRVFIEDRRSMKSQVGVYSMERAGQDSIS